MAHASSQIPSLNEKTQSFTRASGYHLQMAQNDQPVLSPPNFRFISFQHHLRSKVAKTYHSAHQGI